MSDSSPCGIDLGAGCTEGSSTEAEPLPPVQNGAVNVYGTCGLPPDPGTCAESTVRYAWVPALAACAPFHYSGCGGNANRFDTEEACLGACGDRPVLTQCSCEPGVGSCDPRSGCSKCPANTNLSADLGSLACDSVGLFCDSGERCGTFCECVADDPGGAVWACASRLC